jgi:hypothetical protein
MFLRRKIAKTHIILAQNILNSDFNVFEAQNSQNPHHFSSKYKGK